LKSEGVIKLWSRGVLVQGPYDLLNFVVGNAVNVIGCCSDIVVTVISSRTVQFHLRGKAVIVVVCKYVLRAKLAKILRM
jgi:hypothetical protein